MPFKHSQTKTTERLHLWVQILLIGIIWIAAQGAVEVLTHEEQEEYASTLTTIHNAVHTAIHGWTEDQFSAVRTLARNPKIVTETEVLLQALHEPQYLVYSPMQEALRHEFELLLDTGQYDGYFIIARDNISVASSRDENIGSRNILVGQADVMARLWAGEMVLSRPMPSSVPLADANGTKQMNSPTMFVGAPIRNTAGEVIAILTLRLDPARSLYRLLEQGRPRDTGKTYIFDADGNLLSPSHFDVAPTPARADDSAMGAGGFLGRPLRIPAAIPGSQVPLKLTHAVDEAIKGNNGADMRGYPDYRGEPVIGIWRWDRKLGFGLVTELDAAEAYHELRIAKGLMYAGAMLASGLILFLVWFMRRARRQVAGVEARWQGVFDTAVDGVLITDSKGTIQSSNPAVTRLFGFSPEELLGESVTLLMPPAFRDKHGGYMQRYLQSGRGHSRLVGGGGEFPGQRKDGSQFSFVLTLSEVELDGDIQFAGIIHDLSEQKKLEAEIAAERQFNADTLDGLAEAIAVLDEVGNIIFVNKVWRAFGAANNREDCESADLGTNYLEVTEAAADDPHAQHIAEALLSLLEGRTAAFTAEYPCHSPHENRWFQMRASCFEHMGRTRVAIAHQDISRQKNAEQALQRANDRLRIMASVAEGTHSAIIVTGPDGRITWVNDGFSDLTHYAGDEVTGQKPGDLLQGPDTDMRARRALAQAVRWAVPIEQEILNYAKDGTPYWARLSISPVRDESGKVVQYVSVAQDISEEKRALEQLESARRSAESAAADLARNQRVLKLALEGSNAGYWHYDPMNEVATWDAQSSRMYGMAPDREFRGSYQDWVQWIHPDDLQEVRNDFSTALENPRASHLELEFRTLGADGEERYLHADGTIERDEQGRALAVYGLHFDLTERWRAQQELLNAKYSLEAVNRDMQLTMQAMDQVGLLLFWIDAEHGQLLNASDSACQRLGFDRKELLTLAWDEICPEMSQKTFADRMSAVRDQGYGRYESIMMARGEELFAVEVLAFYRAATAQQPATLIVFATDITERKQAEADLIMSREAAESASRAKSSFLAAMSHEIRTPINGVVGIADLLKETRLDIDQRSMVRTMRASALALRTIIDDILDFSKIEAGKLSLEDVPVSPIALIEEVVDTLGPQAAENKVRMDITVDPGLNRWFRGDPVRIRQILFNLGSNAIKFSGKQKEVNGHVTFRLEPAPEGAGGPSMRMIFSVMDNGIGIAADAQKNLFRPFTQAEISTTRRFGGTGLGLAISRQLANLMGGEITLQSTEGEGSTFSLVLDLPQIEHQEAPPLGTWDFEGAKVVCIGVTDPEAERLSGLMAAFNATLIACDADKAAELLGSTHAATDRVAVLIDAQRISDREQAICNFMDDAGHCVVLRPRNRSDGNCQRCIDVRRDPWLPSELLGALAVALGFASADSLGSADEPASTAREPLSVEQAEAEGQLILVAEDNETNREVMARQLALLGYTHIVGEDGVEALELWQKHRFGLVLTDCHMPRMDGYELSAAIRAGEQDSDSRVPIVAVTANALKGEAERCHAAGMDDYLSKPVELHQLKKLLHKWLPLPSATAEPEAGGAERSSTTAPGAAAATSAVVDPDALSRIVGDDPVIIASFLKKFVPQAQEILSDLERAYAAKDADAVRFQSHKLKSSSRAIGAASLGELCANLETAGRNNAWPEVEALYPQLDPAFDAVVDYIENC